MGVGFFKLSYDRAMYENVDKTFVVDDEILVWNDNIGKYEYSSGIKGTLIMRFLRSFYWAAGTIVSCGYGDLIPNMQSPVELLYSYITGIVSLIVSFITLANLAIIFGEIDDVERAFIQVSRWLPMLSALR